MLENATTQMSRLKPLGRRTLIWQMIGLAVVVHGALLLLLSPKLLSSDVDSPEQLFERAEAELAKGRYTEAMALYQRVMDLQPKIPPVFEKAAEQHKLADRLSRQYQPTTAPADERGPDEATTTAPATRPVKPDRQPATRPDPNQYIPPELRNP